MKVCINTAKHEVNANRKLAVQSMQSVPNGNKHRNTGSQCQQETNSGQHEVSTHRQ